MIESAHGFILTLHIAATIVTITIVLATDLYALTWLIGKNETLSPTIIRHSHTLVWTGLILTMSMGFLLFLPYAAYLLTDLAFRIKLFLILFLIVNAFVIGKHMHHATSQPFASLHKKDKVALLLSGAVSSFGWIGAIVAAQFIAL